MDEAHFTTVCMHKVYIIIVNFNKFKDTIECLESLLKSSYSNFQIFVVDNSSSDVSSSELTDWANNNNYPGIETAFDYLVNPPVLKPVSHTLITEADFNTTNQLFNDQITIIRAHNNGFAAANNVVLKYLQNNAEDESFIWLLNNDTVVAPDALARQIDFYKFSGRSKYIVGAQLRNYNHPAIIQAIAGRYNTWLGMHKHIGEGEADTGQYNNYQPAKNDYVVGASMFLPKLFLDSVGLMCADYFLYFEELDWINAGHKKGFEMAAVTGAVVYHKEGASIINKDGKQKDTTIAEYYSITNRVRFIKKWYPYSLLTVMPGVIFALLKRLLQGKFALVARATGTIIKILFGRNVPVIKYNS